LIGKPRGDISRGINSTTFRASVLAAALIGVCLVLVPSRAVQSANDNKAATQRSRDAGVIFAKSCATCHGKDGQAKTFKAKFNHAPDLTDAKWQADVSDEHLFNSITNGKGKMPAFGKKLSVAEINGLVVYVRHLKR
jgi:mono/diheme cytochrome c family protein